MDAVASPVVNEVSLHLVTNARTIRTEVKLQNSGRSAWEALADELRKTHDIQRLGELVMLLEEAIFNRQQELALNAGKIARRDIEEEEHALKRVLDFMLETKVKKLGFPQIR